MSKRMILPEDPDERDLINPTATIIVPYLTINFCNVFFDFSNPKS